MKKFIHFFLLIMFVLLAACGSNNGEQEGQSDNAFEGIQEELGDPDGAKESTTDEESEQTEIEYITEIGIYNGQADPHTIEIETESGPTAFQLTDEAREDVTELKEDEEVVYTYFHNDEQLVIELIEPYWKHREHSNNRHHMQNMPHHQGRHHLHNMPRHHGRDEMRKWHKEFYDQYMNE